MKKEIKFLGVNNPVYTLFSHAQMIDKIIVRLMDHKVKLFRAYRDTNDASTAAFLMEVLARRAWEVVEMQPSYEEKVKPLKTIKKKVRKA